jgi:hypothetical protein
MSSVSKEPKSDKHQIKEKIQLILQNIDPTERQILLQSLAKNSNSFKQKK